MIHGRAMTRYSRSVIPGRPQGEDGGEKAAIDHMIFGAAKRGPVAANDASEPDFLPPVEDDEADLLVGRSNIDRRKKADRRQNDDRRASARKQSDYAPLREQGGYRGADDSRRGPVLLVGALLIVAVFGVVVWNAYREDGAGAAAEVAELGDSGPFKRPFIDTRETPAPTIAEQAEVLDALDGAPSKPVTSSEVRPVTPQPAAAPPPAAAETPPAKRQPQPEAKPPVPLNTPPAASPPVRAATAVTQQQGPVSLTPAKPQAAVPPPVVAPPAAATTPPASASAQPTFAAGGAWLAQIASTSSEAGALEEWGRLSRSWPDLFSSAQRVVQQADVNGKTVYRVRVGSFASKEDATGFCSAVKARGGNCYPAAK